MMIETMSLYGEALDYAVLRVLKRQKFAVIRDDGLFVKDEKDNLVLWAPSARIEQGMRIAFERRVSLFWSEGTGNWMASYRGYSTYHKEPLVAAMRVICMAELKDRTSIPVNIADVEHAAQQQAA